jgi:hypothetical protein
MHRTKHVSCVYTLHLASCWAFVTTTVLLALAMWPLDGEGDLCVAHAYCLCEYKLVSDRLLDRPVYCLLSAQRVAVLVVALLVHCSFYRRVANAVCLCRSAYCISAR